MDEEKKHLLTPEGLKRLQDELHDLEVHKLKEVRTKIAEARELGDLSENAEYDAAMDEQRDIVARIKQIHDILADYEIIEGEGDGTVISTGCTVKIRDIELKEEEEYQIVGSTEANILEGRISNESPIGMALLGAKKGETVKVETPAGLLKYKVLSFSR